MLINLSDDQAGDVIVAVDGEATNDFAAVSAAVRGSDAIGTPCTITLERDNTRFNVELIRGSNTRVRSIEKLFKLLQTAEAHALGGSMEAVLKTISQITGSQITSNSKLSVSWCC
jgi:membrane-associated protease RseP (regulator of RpoE activity)